MEKGPFVSLYAERDEGFVIASYIFFINLSIYLETTQRHQT